MSDVKPQIIIVKKSGRHKKEHHGGSWKIAYADFVTAMMAFFMLLWLLSLLNKYQLQGISAYFQKPLKDIFVGSKNAEQYKNQTSSKIIQIKKDIGGAANSDLKDEKSTKSSVKMESKAADDADKKDKAGKKDDIDNKKNDEAAKSGTENKTEKKGVNKEMEKLKRRLEISLQNNSKVHAMKDNVSFSVVKDGVKVSLHDSANNQMFSLGKPDFKNYAKPVITWLSTEFNKIPKKVIIVGHTDAWQYEPKAKYSNWELSADRANTVRHLLIIDGMDSGKIIRVEGAADVSLLDKEGDNPINRRVEIIVLTDEAAKRYSEQ